MGRGTIVRHMEGIVMATNILNKLEHFSPMLQTTKRGLLPFPKRKKGKGRIPGSG
jgi:hypothetical protein